MSNIPNLTDTQILSAVKLAEGFKGFPNGILDVWVRSDEDAYNKFDDKVYTFDCTGGVIKFVMVCTGTSNAGAEGLKHFDKYNREGCAVLKSNIIVYNSHAYGLHKGKYPAYRQAKDFPYYRDGDKDNRAEEIGAVHHGIIGANCHKAGWFSTEIGGWSVACLVRNQQAQFDAWMRFMNRRPLTVCILQERFIVNPPLREVTPANVGAIIDEKVSAAVPASSSATNSSQISQAQDETSNSPVIPATENFNTVGQNAPNNPANEQPPIQQAENITNVSTAAKAVPDNFVPETKTVEAPPKENSTATAAKMTIAGFAVPTFLVVIIETVKDLISQGFVNAAQIGEVVVGFIRENTRYLFYLIGLIIVGLILKKAFKQITLWLSVYLTARADTHDVQVVPNGEKKSELQIEETQIRPVFEISED